MQKLFLYRSIRFKYRKFMCFVAMLFTLLAVASVQPAHAQDMAAKKVSMKLNNATIKEAFAAIQQQSGFKFVYGPDINKYNTVKITLNGSYTVKQAIDQVLKNTNLRYTQRGSNVMVDENPEGTAPTPKQEQTKVQQNGRISGKVIDDLGEPLIGASIRVVGNNSIATQSATDGSYSLSVKPGTYALEVSYISFQTQRITDVTVKDNGNTPLTISMKAETNTLQQVVVSSGYKKASVAGLYAEQKNRASVSDGISAEQIARTADNNIGQVLKRVSGVTTVDNKYVVVRGLGDRYNQAMVDGVVLPSTNMNRRNFSFDVVPQELVSSVVVNKTATPDMSAEFSGGQVIVNTMDIPTDNFTTLTIGTGMNTQSTGKDFYTLGERKGADYLGLSNHRKEPAGLQSWFWHSGVNTPPLGPNGNYPAGFPTDLELTPGSGIPYTSLDAIEQSRKLNAADLRMADYKAIPFSNARLALGRVYDLKNNLRFGFSGGATYRNQQTIVDFNNVRGNAGPEHNYMDSVENNPGTSYRFNSTIGAALNMGLQGNNFKIALKNMYSRIFQDQFNETYRINYGASNETKSRELFQDPQVTAVWQHKLEGQNLLGSTGVKMDYTFGITRISQQIQDQRRLKYRRSALIGGTEYFQTPDIYDPNRLDDDYDYRMWTDVKETDYNWGLSFSKDFSLGSRIKNTAKLGYSGWNKQRTLGVTKLIPYTSFTDINNPIEGLYSDILSAEKVGAEKGQAYYWADNLNGPTFDGSMATHAPYLMLDQRFFEKLRLVYGVRAEHYNLANRQEEYITRRFGEIPDHFALFSTTGEKDWRLLPSANLTYSLTPQMNARLAYSKTAIRPDFRESGYFGFYDFELDATITGRQVVSTIVDNFDLRYEWYPSPGEIISISGFYKKMKDPIELVFVQDGQYRFQNQYAAKNYGVEMEIRKSLGFISDKQWLQNITLFGNGTLLKSKVEVQDVPMPGENRETVRYPYLDRPLYGQAPWIINGGIAYQDEIFGFTASYNKSGHRSNTINLDPASVEYEKGRNMLDAQISAKILKRKAELKLDVSNLLDEYILFYQNINAYEHDDPNATGSPMKLKSGNTTAYQKDKGDRVTYRAKTGRNISLSFTYRF
ncbi:TonB-dependent receptor [Sphingobacterium hotanense]|uniref:TonB-dependent receptor n=1 Tax=Sphingobacterium hotanense TaxID=649196 RepID=UPI0021A4F61E|nr:TonB-dependent receptor [Sphingobacterium hotanense]MCT1523858.1 TonB-dependent receptor [Sphingobacterium hotanense]